MSSRINNETDVDWPEDDVIELLAQLDFLVEMPQESSCLLKENQRKEADEKIIVQLSNTIDGRYSPREVRNKLLSLYAEGDATEYLDSNFTIVFRLGSQEMRALDDPTRKRVLERLNELQWGRAGTRRSSSRRLTPATNRVHKRCKNPPRYQTRSRTATPCNNSVKRKGNSKRISRMSPSVVIPSIKREGSTFTQSHVDLLRGLSEVRDSMEEDSDQIFSGEPSPNHLLTPDTSRYNYAQKRLRQSPHTPEPIPGIMLDIEEHEDLMHQLSHFRQKWKQAESEIEQLKRESREKEALLAKSHSASFSFEAEIRRKNARIADLESQVSKQACLQPYLDLESGDLSAETIGEIRSKIAILGKRISAIELMSGLEYPALNDIAVEGSSELLEMVNSTLGYDVHGPVHRIKDIMDANISPQQFIQSLIGAAVCEKVFRQKFKCIDMVSTSLLDEYRNHIAAACNKTILRNLDFASHRSLISNEQFQNLVLHRKAKALAKRHLKILTPFIADRTKTECTDKLMLRLEGIFTVALSLKVLLMTTKDMFECIWPTAGSEFDIGTMETAWPRRQGINQHDPTGRPRVVLPVAPGLHLYSHNRQMVDYNAFIEVGKHMDGQSRVISKSVVWV